MRSKASGLTWIVGCSIILIGCSRGKNVELPTVKPQGEAVVPQAPDAHAELPKLKPQPDAFRGQAKQAKEDLAKVESRDAERARDDAPQPADKKSETPAQEQLTEAARAKAKDALDGLGKAATTAEPAQAKDPGTDSPSAADSISAMADTMAAHYGMLILDTQNRLQELDEFSMLIASRHFSRERGIAILLAAANDWDEARTLEDTKSLIEASPVISVDPNETISFRTDMLVLRAATLPEHTKLRLQREVLVGDRLGKKPRNGLIYAGVAYSELDREMAAGVFSAETKLNLALTSDVAKRLASRQILRWASRTDRYQKIENAVEIRMNRTVAARRAEFVVAATAILESARTNELVASRNKVRDLFLDAIRENSKSSDALRHAAGIANNASNEALVTSRQALATGLSDQEKESVKK